MRRLALSKQIRAPDLTGAAMGPQGASTEQTGIRPGQGILQHATIASSAKLSCSTIWRGQAAIQADRDN